MPGFNMFKAVPSFAVSSLTAALIVAFPVAHAEPVSSHSYTKNYSYVKEYGRNTKVEKKKRKNNTYTYLEAGRNGKITGQNVDVEGSSGTLVFAKNGGYIELKKVDIETGDSHRKHGNRNTKQGPAVKASDTGSPTHHSNKSGKPSKISLKEGLVTTHNQNSPALQASNGGMIFIDGTELRTYGKNSDVVQAISGGYVSLYDADIESKEKNANGVNVSGRKSEVSIKKSEIETKGREAHGVSVRDGGKATIQRSEIETKGEDADGVNVSGRESEAYIANSEIETKGRRSNGVSVSHGGEAVVVKSTITTNKEDSVGLNVSSGGKALVNRSVITTRDEDSVGINVSTGGKALVNQSFITTRDEDSIGIDVSSGGRALVSQSFITTHDEDSVGINVNNGGKALVNRSVITTRDEDSIGINVGKSSKAQIDQSLITTFDDDSVGINVERGGKVLVDQSIITTLDDDSVGINASKGGKAFVNQSFIATFDDDSIGVNVSKGGKAIVSQSIITAFDGNSTGVKASKGGKAFITESVIATTDWNSDAVKVRDGGFVALDKTDVFTSSWKSNGLDVSGKDSLAWVAGSSIETDSLHADGVNVRRGGAVVLMDSEIVSKGVGLNASDKARALLKESDIRGGSAGIVIRDGARVAVLGGSVSANGSNATALSIGDAGSRVAISGAELTATDDEGVALDVAKEGRAHVSNSKLNGQSIGLQADGTGTKVSAIESTVTAGLVHAPRLLVAPPTEPIATVGVLSRNGAEVTLSTSRVTATGNESVAVKTEGGTVSIDAGTIIASGANSTALWASQGVSTYAITDMKSAVVATTGIDVAGTAISTTGDYAVAARATGSDSAVRIDKASALSTTGQKSHGALAEDGGLISLKNSKINVSGSNTAAARVQSVATDSQPAVSRLVVEGSSLVASGANSSGIELENSARVSLIDSVVRSTGASITATLNKGGQTQDIVVGSGARLVDNNGTLLQVNRSVDGGSSKVMLDLQDHSVTQGNIIDGLQTPLSGEGGTYVQLGALATFDGYVSGVRQITTKGGNQTLKFEGGSTIDELSIDNNAKTSGGTVDNPIVVYGNALVDNATLGGNWTIKGVLISTNGGIVKPGNSVGVISANSINWGPGTVYQAEINEAGQSDLIQVTGSGAADISNTSLVVSPENGVGRFLLNRDYTVLTANGGVQGEFIDTEWTGATYPLIAMNTLYSENAVAVRMGVNEQALNTMDFTPNQRSAGFGAASVVGKNASVDEAFFSSNPAQAFDQLSGEVHATARSLLFSDMLATNVQLQSQMRSNLGVSTQSGTSLSTNAADTSFKPGDRPLWVRVNAGSLHADGDGNAADARHSATRLMMGGDGAVGGGWRVGAAGAVSSGNFSIDDRRSDGSLSSYTLALYGGNSWNIGSGKLNVLLGGGYTKHDVDTKRNVDVASAQTLRADYHGSTWQMFGDVGYAIPWGTAHNIEPYVNVSWFNQRMDGFDEAGGDAALSSGSSSADLTSYTLGLRSALVFPGKTQAFTVRTNLGWRHATGDRAPTRSMSFVEGAGSAFSIAGAPIAKDSLLVGLSAEVSMDEHASLGISYNGEFGSGVSDNAGSLFLKVRF